VLAKYLTIEPALIQYRLGDRGKPSLKAAGYDSRALKFNLSHTQDITLLAVTSDTEVGIDIEYMDRKTDREAIGQRFFTAPEQRVLFSLAKEKQKRAFYQLWTRKEAYMKVLGSGLSLPPTAFTLTVPPQPPALVQHHSTKYQPFRPVEFATIELPDALNNYCATLAAESSIHESHCYQYIGDT
ncbi:MAG: 4'-phosphopantetheinyl transferase superfamily protein, partial [Gammaproteobacteria bacterium]|nr:4'-phosphopantetheinyl transferase superfamily protein [Gammaproteobacteria bacterium]